MDDEDFSEYGIAPKMVKAKDQFQSTSDSFAGFRENLNSATEAKLDDVLKKMITLKSVSIGIRILKRMKKHAVQKMSKDNYLDNCRVFPLQFDESELKALFLNPKRNFYGLGFTGLKTNLKFTHSRVEETSAELNAVMKDGKKLKIQGEAFGFGALDEDDGFETEVYTFDDLSKYDYQLGGKGDKTSANLLSSILSDTHLMDDFKKSEEFYADFDENKNRNIINVPANWRPRPPVCSSKKRKSRWDDSKKEESSDHKIKKEENFKKLNAIQRAEILGECDASLEREEINMKLNKIKEENLNSIKVKEENKVDELLKEEKESSLPVFKKPLTGYFASKFVQSDEVSISDLKPGLNKVENLPNLTTNQAKPLELKEETKSFVGKSNREIYQWNPHKLVCKRFNVAFPKSNSQFPDIVGVLTMIQSKDGQKVDSVLPSSFTSKSAVISQSSKPNKPTQNEPIKKVEEEKIEEFKKPDMSLFKAVFDLSEEESDIDDLDDIEDINENDNKDKLDNRPEKVEEPIKEVKPDESSKEAPRILFNKAFIKKSDVTNNSNATNSSSLSKESKPEKSKVSLNLFENEDDLGSEDEDLNLPVIKKPIKPIKESQKVEEPSKRQAFDCEKPKELVKLKEEKLDLSKDDSSKFLDQKNYNEERFNKSKDKNLRMKRNVSDSDSDDDVRIECDKIDNFIDDIANEIIEPNSSHKSSHKKKRKKHKEHKKHKKKKHKSDKSD